MKELLTIRDVLSAQSSHIVKANDLITKSRYKLTLMETKIVLFAISQIQPDDKPFQSYSFRIKDFVAVCNLNKQSGTYKKYISKVVNDLGQKVLNIELEPGKTLITHWFSSCVIDTNNGVVKFTFDPNIAPYLFELKKFYTQYAGEFVYCMSSVYSIRLYEYLRSIKSKYYRQRVSVDEIRNRIECFSNLDDYTEFRYRVLDPAIKEINKYSDLKVSYKGIKDGYSIKYLEFTMLKHSAEEIQKRMYNRREKLGSLTDE